MQQQSQHHENPAPEQSERQEFHNSHVAIGVATHLIRTAGALLPFAILEFEKNPTRATRLIKMGSILTAGLNETLWALKVGKSREREHHR